MHYYQRHFPALTNRYVFEPERTPSPIADHPTNRRVFQSESADPLPPKPYHCSVTTSRDSGQNVNCRRLFCIFGGLLRLFDL